MGFAGSDDYYRRASALPYLGRIRVPTLIIHAKDDPFIPFSQFERKELASLLFVPRFVDVGQGSYESFELEKVFENPTPGGNFSFGLGLGVAILVEKMSDGILTVPAAEAAFLRINEVTVEFTGKSRIETVKV